MGNHTSLVRIFVVGLATIALAASLAYADPPPEEVWNVTYQRDNGHSNYALDLTIDDAGFIYVTGYGKIYTSFYYLTIKYDSEANRQWVKFMDSEMINVAHGVAVDETGFVYVAGASIFFNRDTIFSDYQTVKYNSDGNFLWMRSYHSNDEDEALDIAVDGSDFIYMTGKSGSSEGPYDYWTIKCDADGDVIWKKVYDLGDDNQAYGVTVDDKGFVYVTGATYRTTTGYDYLTIKYDSDGSQIWKSSYISFDDDWASGVAVDKNGNVYVTGRSGSEEEGFNYLTVKYDGEGNRLWERTYDNGGDDRAESIAVDDAGCIYVTGWSHNGLDYDYRTIKYDSDGDIRWEKLFDSQVDDCANGVGVDSEGFVYVTGFSDGAFRTIKYRQILGIDEDIPVRVDPTLSLGAAPGGSITIRYQLTSPCKVSLSIYDALGRKVAILVDAQKPVGEHEYSWTPDGAGVYFVRFQAGGSQTTRKFVSLR
jgi:hypothetical protein